MLLYSSLMVPVYSNFSLLMTHPEINVIPHATTFREHPHAGVPVAELSPSSMMMEERTLTVLFIDLVGYTRIAERMPLAQLLIVVNTFLEAVSEVIQRYEGTIGQAPSMRYHPAIHVFSFVHADKFMGDACMAFWNAPLPVTNHALKVFDLQPAACISTAGFRHASVRSSSNTPLTTSFRAVWPRLPSAEATPPQCPGPLHQAPVLTQTIHNPQTPTTVHNLLLPTPNSHLLFPQFRPALSRAASQLVQRTRGCSPSSVCALGCTRGRARSGFFPNVNNVPPASLPLGVAHIKKVGTVGSDLRRDYTVIGDTVNVASRSVHKTLLLRFALLLCRLEDLNRVFGTTIMVSEAVVESLAADQQQPTTTPPPPHVSSQPARESDREVDVVPHFRPLGTSISTL